MRSGEGVVRRLDLALEKADTRLDHVPVLSPDGSRIAYTSGGSLWIRSLAEFAPREVPKSAGAAYPFWAPDSQNIAFIVDGKLWRAPVKDGEPELVGAVPIDMAGSGAGVWTAAGNFVVVGSDQTGITEISGKDGSSREILALDRKRESDFHEISELPGGRGLLFTTHTDQGADTIVLLVDGKRREVLKLAGRNAARACLRSGWVPRFQSRDSTTRCVGGAVLARHRFPPPAPPSWSTRREIIRVSAMTARWR